MREFTPDDLGQINAWYRGHDWPELAAEQARMKGFIVDGVAAGFLMQTDSGVAYLENFVSNPDAPPRNVASAIDQITAALLGFAVAAGFTRVAAITRLPSIEKRARRFGLRRHPGGFRLLTKELP